jgi:hypothetical protein
MKTDLECANRIHNAGPDRRVKGFIQGIPPGQVGTRLRTEEPAAGLVQDFRNVEGVIVMRMGQENGIQLLDTG